MPDKKPDQIDEKAKEVYNGAMQEGARPYFAVDRIAAFGRQCADEARREAFLEAAGMLEGEELLTPGSIRLRWANKMRARASSSGKTGEREGA